MSEDRGAAAQQPQESPHVRAMETALGLLSAAGRAAVAAPSSRYDLRPLARALERAITGLLDAYDHRREPTAATRDALSACDEALYELERAVAVDPALGELRAWIDGARGWLAVPEQHFAKSHAVPEPPREIVASHDAPVLFRIERATIAPLFDVAPPLPPPDPAVEELQRELAALPPKERLTRVREHTANLRETSARRRDEREQARRAERERKRKAAIAEPPPGFVRGEHRAVEPQRHRWDKGRELFEDVCGMGILRTPLLGDYWRGSIVFDRRMLRDIDAIAALGGGVVGALERMVTDSPAKDPSRAFGLAAALGCFEGRDGLAAVERVARELSEDAAALVVSLGSALKLIPHPTLPAVLRRWLTDESAPLRTVAIEVLGHRGWASDEELCAAARDSDEACAAAALLQAAARDVHDLSTLCQERADAKSPALKAALAWAAVLGSLPYPLDRLRGMLGGEDEEHAFLPIALAGEKADVDALTARYHQRPTRALAAALGYGGAPEAIAALVGTLEAESAPELKLAAAFALQRLTGGELYDDADVPPEKIEVEEPADPPLPEDLPALRRISSDPRDRPGAGAPDRMRLPTVDPAVWRAFLAEQEVAFQGERRLRRGKPYTPLLSYAELDTYQITPHERRVLAREILIKTGRHVAFDPVDFVPVQEQALRAMAPLCEKAASQPGAWGKALRR